MSGDAQSRCTGFDGLTDLRDLRDGLTLRGLCQATAVVGKRAKMHSQMHRDNLSIADSSVCTDASRCICYMPSPALIPSLELPDSVPQRRSKSEIVRNERGNAARAFRDSKGWRSGTFWAPKQHKAVSMDKWRPKRVRHRGWNQQPHAFGGTSLTTKLIALQV